jgi:AraC-like DNA-binding protein
VKTVEEAALACHMDAAYLSRLFRRFAHTTPHRFLMRLKMNRAAGLLLDDGLMVKETAAELGFADAFHFSRAFKRVYGIAPERFVTQGRAVRRGASA